MLIMILIMAGCGMWLEMRVVNSCSPLGDLLERTRVGSAVFSLGLSVLLGMLFGAAGLIVFVSGILSTVLIQPWYAMRRAGTLDKIKVQKVKVRQSFTDANAKITAKKDVYVRRAHQIGMVMKLIIAVLAFPFVVCGKVMDAVDKMTSKIK